MSPPLVPADISIHEGLFRPVRLLLYVQINSVFHVNFLLLILILWPIPLYLLMIHLLVKVGSISIYYLLVVGKMLRLFSASKASRTTS